MDATTLIPAVKNNAAATELERLAGALRAGTIDYSQAVVVFHDNQSRAVHVVPCGQTGQASERDNATLAALQRGAVRWALAIE